MSRNSPLIRGFASWTTESGACTWRTTCSTGAMRSSSSTPCPSRGSPGTLHVFEADHESLSATAGLDAHAMDPAAVFASLNALGGTPPHTIVIGCEVDTVEEGIGLSEAVAATVPDAVDAVNNVVAGLLARESVAEG